MGFRSPINGIPPSGITADMLEDGSVTGSKIGPDAVQTTHLAADAITAKHTITGAKFRTAAAGQRWEIDSDLNNEIRAYSDQEDELEPGKLLISGPVLELRGARTTNLPTEGEEPKLELTHQYDGTWSGLASLIGGGELHLVGMREVDEFGGYSTNDDNLILTKGDTQIRGAVTIDYATTIAPVLDVGSDYSPIGKTRIDETGIKVYEDVDPNITYPPSTVVDGDGVQINSGSLTLNGSRPLVAFDCGRLSISNATDANGEYTFSHDLGVTPACIQLTSRHTGVVRHYVPLNPTATTITVRVRDGAGALVPAGSLVSFEWSAYA